MMAGKVVGLEFEIISKLDSYFLITVTLLGKFITECIIMSSLQEFMRV